MAVKWAGTALTVYCVHLQFCKSMLLIAFIYPGTGIYWVRNGYITFKIVYTITSCVVIYTKIMAKIF